MRQANKRGQDATGPERGEKAASYNGRPKSMEHERREEKTDQQSEKKYTHNIFVNSDRRKKKRIVNSSSTQKPTLTHSMPRTNWWTHMHLFIRHAHIYSMIPAGAQKIKNENKIFGTHFKYLKRKIHNRRRREVEWNAQKSKKRKKRAQFFSSLHILSNNNSTHTDT